MALTISRKAMVSRVAEKRPSETASTASQMPVPAWITPIRNSATATSSSTVKRLERRPEGQGADTAGAIPPGSAPESSPQRARLPGGAPVSPHPVARSPGPARRARPSSLWPSPRRPVRPLQTRPHRVYQVVDTPPFNSQQRQLVTRMRMPRTLSRCRVSFAS